MRKFMVLEACTALCGRITFATGVYQKDGARLFFCLTQSDLQNRAVITVASA